MNNSHSQWKPFATVSIYSKFDEIKRDGVREGCCLKVLIKMHEMACGAVMARAFVIHKIDHTASGNIADGATMALSGKQNCLVCILVSCVFGSLQR